MKDQVWAESELRARSPEPPCFAATRRQAAALAEVREPVGDVSSEHGGEREGREMVTSE